MKDSYRDMLEWLKSDKELNELWSAPPQVHSFDALYQALKVASFAESGASLREALVNIPRVGINIKNSSRSPVSKRRYPRYSRIVAALALVIAFFFTQYRSQAPDRLARDNQIESEIVQEYGALWRDSTLEPDLFDDDVLEMEQILWSGVDA